MKQIGIFCVITLLLLPTVGCICYPGYYNGGCGSGVPLGCGSVLHQGVVDYVDGGPGATQADCGGGCYTTNTCGPCVTHGMTNCGSCLGVIGDGVRAVGEGAFTLAASPFIFLGTLITGGGCGYETYPNCGCSNEVYYGDNCYQQHDFCDPCAGSCDPCGGGSSAATSGCATCSGGHVEGLQFEGSGQQSRGVQTTSRTYNQQPVRTPTQARAYRPVTQMSYRQPVQKPAQRVVPPQQTRQTIREVPPRPLTISDDNQKQALPQ